MAKQHMAFTFGLAAQSGPYHETSILPADLDIQLTLSRNDRPQPFHLICEHDTVLVAMSGRGRVEFRQSSVLYFGYAPGDVIYVPAGVPHRILPSEESIQHRFKLPESELEGVAWYCEGCGAELHRDIWSLVDASPRQGYLRACTRFNDEASLRCCGSCGATRPELDLVSYRWEENPPEDYEAHSPA